MIVFISCTKNKQDARCTAEKMYSKSAWFNKALRYARTLNPHEIYILSAKYGLLQLDDVIDPYDQSLVGARKAEIQAWSDTVEQQIKEKSIDQKQTAVFLCGGNYRKHIQHLFQSSEIPCKGMGLGKQLQYFDLKVGEHEENNRKSDNT